jgi:transforming growth factor-beta-induced protein
MEAKRMLSTVGVLVLALGGPIACGDSDSDSSGDDGENQGDDADAGDDGDSEVDDGSDDEGDGADEGEESLNIVETAVAAGDFTVLAGALEATGLDEALAGDGPFTVFAPTDAAFAALGEGVLDSLTTEQLSEILQYHVIGQQVLSTDLEAGVVTTLSGLSAFVSLEGGVSVNDANVTTADVQASNGVIHVIDKVLLPPNIAEAATYAGSFSTLLSAVETAGLTAALTDPEAELTVFAPTDAAFAALPEGTLESLTTEQLTDILTYHVVPAEVLSSDLEAGEVETLLGQSVTISLEGGVSVNDAQVVLADIVTTNGIIHVIDGVLLPE